MPDSNDWEVQSSFTVRSYELDSYAHLNNGVYLSWYEQGRLDYLRALGFSYDGFADRSEWFVVGRTEVVFKRALHEAETVDLLSSVESLGRSSVKFRQVMRLVEASPAEHGAGPLVSQSNTVMVFSDQSQSIPIPGDFRTAVESANRPR